MSLSRRTAFACLLTLSAAACKNTEEPKQQAKVPFTGTFALQTIDGQNQLIIGSGLGTVTRIVSGKVVVKSDGTVIDVLRKQVFAGSTPQGAEVVDSVELPARRAGGSILIDRLGALGSTDTLDLQEQDFLIVHGTMRVHTLAGTPVKTQHVGAYVRTSAR
jgi:hypothetical protein